MWDTCRAHGTREGGTKASCETSPSLLQPNKWKREEKLQLKWEVMASEEFLINWDRVFLLNLHI